MDYPIQPEVLTLGSGLNDEAPPPNYAPPPEPAPPPELTAAGARRLLFTEAELLARARRGRAASVILPPGEAS